MTAHELAKKLLELPDFEVVFTGDVTLCSCETPTARYDFSKLEVFDVGYSDQVVILSGKEIE